MNIAPVLQSLKTHGLKEGLEKFEVPQAVTLIPGVDLLKRFLVVADSLSK